MFFLDRNNRKTILLINVQSSFIRASLIVSSKTSIPEIIFTTGRKIPTRLNKDNEYLIKATINTIDSVIGSCGNTFIPANISEVHFILSSPWAITHAKNTSMTFVEPTTVTKDNIVKLIGAERREEKSKSKDIELIEEKIFSVRLNGYHVDDWQGKTVDCIDISSATSVAGSGIIQKFREICSQILKNEKSIYFHSTSLLYYAAIKSILPLVSDYTLVDIHGESTDVLLVENGVCVSFGSFPKGIDSITHTVAQTIGVDESVADSLITLSVGRHLDASKEKDTIDLLDKVIKDWNIGFDKVLSNVINISRPLETIMIIADMHEELFAHHINSFHSGSKIYSLSFEQISSSVSFGPNVEKLIPNALYTIAINSLSNNT
ncbi:MAG: hypothetical protein WCW03_00575 [Candidatus Paceibacterota bacterium]|jgi:hypothetical protein